MLQIDLNSSHDMVMRLQEAAHHQDVKYISDMLIGMPLSDVLDCLQQARHEVLMTIMYGHLARLLSSAPLEDAQRISTLEWLVDYQKEAQHLDNTAAKQSFGHLFGTGIVRLCSRLDELSRVMDQLIRPFDYDNSRYTWVMGLLLAIIEAAAEYPQMKCLKILQGNYFNAFMFVAHTKLTQLVTRQSEEEEIWRWSGELETTIGCLKLLIALINYDFFGTKRNDQTNEFATDRSPILIPCRPNKHESYRYFDALREPQLITLLSYLHETAESMTIKCLTIELVCDLSRLQIKLFKNQQSFVEFANEIISTLDDIVKFLRLQTNQDYLHCLCYLSNIHKTLTVFSLNKLNSSLLKEWIFNLVDFFKTNVLMRTLISPTLTKPVFVFMTSICRSIALTRFLSEQIRTSFEQVMLEYTQSLMRLSDMQASIKSIRTDVFQIALTLEPDPLLNPPIIEDYLYPYKTYEIRLQLDPINYEELLWNLYMRFEFLNQMLVECLARNEQEKWTRLNRIKQNIVDCVNAVANLSLFVDCPRFNQNHIRSVYVYMMTRLQISPEIVDMIRAFRLPIAEAVSEVNCILIEILELGVTTQQLTENCMYLIYTSAVDRQHLYKQLVDKIQSIKAEGSSSKQLQVYYKFCFLLATDNILADMLCFMGEDFKLETAVDFFHTVRRYNLQGKFKVLLQWIVIGRYLSLAVNLIQDPTRTELFLDQAYKVVLVLNSVLKVDSTNQCNKTNKMELCRLFVPIVQPVVSFLSRYMFECSTGGNNQKLSRMFRKLLYVLKRLLEFTYMDIKQLCLDPCFNQIRSAVCQVMQLSTEMPRSAWIPALLELCEFFYQNERNLFKNDLMVRFYVILLRFLPKTLNRINEIICCAENSSQLMLLFLQAIDVNQWTIENNAPFIEDLARRLKLDVRVWLNDQKISRNLYQVLSNIAKKLDDESRDFRVGQSQNLNTSIHEETKEQDHRQSIKKQDMLRIPMQSASRKTSGRLSEQAKDVVYDSYGFDF